MSRQKSVCLHEWMSQWSKRKERMTSTNKTLLSVPSANEKETAHLIQEANRSDQEKPFLDPQSERRMTTRANTMQGSEKDTISLYSNSLWCSTALTRNLFHQIRWQIASNNSMNGWIKTSSWSIWDGKQKTMLKTSGKKEHTFASSSNESIIIAGPEDECFIRSLVLDLLLAAASASGAISIVSHLISAAQIGSMFWMLWLLALSTTSSVTAGGCITMTGFPSTAAASSRITIHVCMLAMKFIHDDGRLDPGWITAFMIIMLMMMTILVSVCRRSCSSSRRWGWLLSPMILMLSGSQVHIHRLIRWTGTLLWSTGGSSSMLNHGVHAVTLFFLL